MQTPTNSNDFKIAKLFVITIREFFSNTSLHGFKYLVKYGLSTFEKLFWYIIQLCALAGACYIFLYAFDIFSAKPTFTSLESVNYPIYEIDFPAIAICPVNKISKKAAWKYATDLSNRTKNHTIDWLFENIPYLGHHLEFDITDYDKYIIFQDLLDKIDVNNETNTFYVQDKFEFMISPKCEDLLLRCRWGYTIATDCMKLFEYRKTRQGYCCIFNYIRQFNILSTDLCLSNHYGHTAIILYCKVLDRLHFQYFCAPINSPNESLRERVSSTMPAKPNKTRYIGPLYGLTVILNATTSDYYFSNGDHIGFYVNICTATEYPDGSNGGLTQLIVQANTRSYFKLVPTTVRSKSSIEQYTPQQRGCLFQHELYEEYAGHYNMIDCLQKCKIQKAIALCHCMPFYMPTNFPGNITSPIKCTLADNKCLRESRFKMDAYVFQNTIFDRGLMEESTECLDCLPLCTKTRFRVFSSHSPLNRKGFEHNQSPMLRNLSTYDDISIVQVYYGLPESKLFTADVLMTWQEIVSHFGGLLGLCFGFSLINIVEILYFSTIRLYQNAIGTNSEQKFLDAQQVQPVQRVQRFVDGKEERKIREMYVNDFKVDRRYAFRRF